MDGPLKERDWKYMRSIREDLLQELCDRINHQSSEILNYPDQTPHKRYGTLYDHIQDSDKIVANCFDDWRRSRLDATVCFLRRNQLLTDEHINHFSDDAQDWMKRIEKNFG